MPSATLDRSTPALAQMNPCLVSLMMRSPRRRRMRTDSRSTRAALAAGSSGSMGTRRPSALETTFWVTTSTSPAAQVGPVSHGRRQGVGDAPGPDRHRA